MPWLVLRRDTVVRLRGAVLIGLMLHTSSGYAAQPAWRTEAMHFFARDTPLPEVLKAATSAGGLQVKIAPGMKEPVNGAFDEAPQQVFLKLIDAYGLAWYFDGRVIHVSRASDQRSRTIPFAPMKQHEVARLLSSLGLDDSHLPVRYSDTTAAVTGPSEYVDAIAGAVEQAQDQVPVSPAVNEMAIRVFPLHYAQAQDITYASGNQQQVVPGVASLLRRLMADMPVALPVTEMPMKPNRHTREGGVRAPLPGLRGLGLADSAPPLKAPLPEPGVTRLLGAQAQRNIVADARTNAVVIYDLPSMMPNYERTIALLDQPQDLVEITAAVIDVSTDAARELGIRFGGSGHGGWGGASVSMGSPGQSLAGAGNPLSTQANLATMIGSSVVHLFAKIRALEEHGKARIMSRPQVLTLNNTEAVLSSRDSVYVRVAGNQDVDLYNVDAGLTLKVTPTVESGQGGARDVLLSVQIEDGAFDSSTTVDGIPKVSHNSIVTQAVVRDGESLLVGGYEYERVVDAQSSVPGLARIPLLGGLFKDKQARSERLERLVLITPRIKPLAGRSRQIAGSSSGVSQALPKPRATPNPQRQAPSDLRTQVPRTAATPIRKGRVR